MSIEVLLLSDVPSLGVAGATVKVSDGYARNYLLPKGLAGPVTPATLRRLEKLRKEREELARLQLAEARAKAAKIKGLSVTVRAKTTDGKKLYGSVSANDIVEALAKQGVEVDRSQIELEQPLHEVGQFAVPVKLHAEVSVEIKVWIVEE
ncbi:MAG: 50S ribosomal protein L9 [Kiritimatiellae bacterium]|nr:50S ribosomal protein L9 [Kiritimatiellia bacterium]